MTLTETVEVLAIVRAAYPHAYSNAKEADLKAMVNLWHGMFGEYDKESVMDAVKAFIATDTKGFAPVIGQIREKLDRIQCESFGEMLSPTEAWALVSRAMHNSAYHAAEEFEKLPESIRSVVGGPSQLHDWATTENGTAQSVIASQFQKAYAVRMENRREMRMYPAEVRGRIEQSKREALGSASRTPPALVQGSADLNKHFTLEECRERWKACEVNFDD